MITMIEAITEPMPGELNQQLAKFVELDKELRDAQQYVEQLKKRLADYEPAILDAFADSAMTSARVGGLTVYVKTSKYVSKRGDVEKSAVIQALKDVGLGYMVNDDYNAASLKSKIKEFQDNKVEIPEVLASKLNIGEIKSIETRKS